MKRKFLCLLLFAAIMTTLLTACGNPDGTDDNGGTSTNEPTVNDNSKTSEGGEVNGATAETTDFKLGISINALDAVTNRKMFESAKSYAESLGIEVVATNAGDTTKQAADIENLVESGCDVIIVQNADSSVVSNAVKEASGKGVRIISEESGWMDGVDTLISLNNYKIGAEMCNYLLADIGFEGKVMVTGHNDHPTVRAHMTVFKDMISENPNVELVNEVHTTYPGTTEVTYKGVASGLIQNPDVVAVFASQDLEALGVVQATKEAGVYPNIKTIGHDGSLDVLNEIKSNDCILMTIAPDTTATTKMAVDVACKMMSGEEIKAYYEEAYSVVTDENVDKWIELAKEDEAKYASGN